MGLEFLTPLPQYCPLPPADPRPALSPPHVRPRTASAPRRFLELVNLVQVPPSRQKNCWVPHSRRVVLVMVENWSYSAHSGTFDPQEQSGSEGGWFHWADIGQW